jgi:outer membrane protein TolC
LSFPVILDQYLAQATLTLPLSDYLWRVPAAVAAQGRVVAARKLEEQLALRASAQQGRAQYYVWASAVLAEAVTAKTVSQLQEQLRLVETVSRAGRVPEADVLRADAALAQAQLAQAQALSARQVAQERLKILLHETSSRAYEIGEDLLAHEGKRDTRSLLQAQRIARRTRPEFKLLQTTEQALTKRQETNRAGKYPRLDVFANGYYMSPHPRCIPPDDRFRASWDAGVQLSWSPNDLLSANQDEQQLGAELAEVRARRQSLEDQVQLEVAEAFYALQRARAQVSTSRRGLKAAEAELRARRALFRVGRATTADLLAAETELMRARLARINAGIDVRFTDDRLKFALGEH